MEESATDLKSHSTYQNDKAIEQVWNKVVSEHHHHHHLALPLLHVLLSLSDCNCASLHALHLCFSVHFEFIFEWHTLVQMV